MRSFLLILLCVVAAYLFFGLTSALCEEGPRKIAFPAKALIGHWKNTGSNEEYWFDGKTVVKVAPPGAKFSSPYVVKKNGQGKSITTIELKTGPTGMFDTESQVEFSPDKRRIHYSSRSIGSQEWINPEDWVYVDDQPPPARLTKELANREKKLEKDREEAERDTASKGAQEAASKYVQGLKDKGVASDDNFQFVILYPNLPVAEVVYTLTYTDNAGVKVTGPYTIHMINQRGEWKADGSTPGSRREHLNDPFLGIDGQWHRSPMEEVTAGGMNLPFR